jgi:hypothetical protein
MELTQLIEDLIKFGALLRAVRNPWSPILDRAGLKRAPYQVRHKDGHLIELRPRAGDLFAFYEILLRRDYTADGQNISDGDVVIDVGANIGCFTILASRAVGPAGRVIAIEPDAANFSQLVHNIALCDRDECCPRRNRRLCDVALPSSGAVQLPVFIR